jgi:hypothetical protein
MTVRRVHRIVGITMLLPFVGWAITGLIFFVKPGYGGAYEGLSVKTYPLEQPLEIVPQPDWREFRVLRTILGTHLLVRTESGWRHLQPDTLAAAPPPGEAQIQALVADAFTAHAERYGRISRVSGTAVETDTGARVTVDWNRLSLAQRGRDTDRIDAIYRVHYLQWTGSSAIDKVLGFIGLAMVIMLTALGARLAFQR